VSAAPVSVSWLGYTGFDGFSEFPTCSGFLLLCVGASGVHPRDIVSAKIRAINGCKKRC